MLTQARLRHLLDYDPLSGLFRRRVGKRGLKSRAGQIAGSIDGDGRNWISVDGKKRKAAHLAVLYMTGEWPDPALVVDHKDWNSSNDRWLNLQQITQLENIQRNKDRPK